MEEIFEIKLAAYNFDDDGFQEDIFESGVEVTSHSVIDEVDIATFRARRDVLERFYDRNWGPVDEYFHNSLVRVK